MNWLQRLLGRQEPQITQDPQDEYMTLTALSEVSGIRAGTLRMAIFCKRLEAKKSGHVWLSTPAAVQQAINAKGLKTKR